MHDVVAPGAKRRNLRARVHNLGPEHSVDPCRAEVLSITPHLQVHVDLINLTNSADWKRENIKKMGKNGEKNSMQKNS